MSEFSQCRKQFKMLTEQRLLPPKIFMKLRYIQSSVLDQQNQQQYFNKLPDFQKQSLEEMNKQTQKAMFMGIISCFAIAEKREHFKNIRAKIKKSSSFRDGQNCFINCVGNKLNFIKNKEKDTIWKQFELSKLKIDKMYKAIKKNKFSFCIESQKTEYEIKFQGQGQCAKIHSLLQNLIRQYGTGGNIEITRYNLQQQTQPQKEQEQIMDRIDDKDLTQQLILIQQKGHLVRLKKNIQIQLQEFQDKFKLHRNIHNGKIQINESNNSAKIIIFMQKCKLKQLIECFISLEGWNTNIQNFKIIKKLRANSYLAYIRLKKSSIWSRQKQGYATVSYLNDCFCYAQMENSLQNEFINGQYERSSTICLSKHYICINGVEANQQENSSNMKFNMLAEFTELEDKNNKILISVISNLEYSSYDLFRKKFQVNLEMLKDIPFLNVYYKERTIQNNSLQLFQINRCICSIKPRKLQVIKQDEERSLSSRKGSAANQILQFQQIENQQNFIANSQIIQIIKDQLKEIKNEKIIYIIKTRLHESYYLKHRFILTQKDEQYKKSDYKLNADTDFLFQNGRWKITKDDNYVFDNQQQLNIQKGVLKLVIKQITSNILAGKSIMTMSLPVEIFDKKSLLAGAADLLGFLPYYLNKAVNTDNVIEQIKYVCGAFMFMFACHPKISKPFNPILGETFQAYLGGIPLFIQQVSHHPPISSIYMKTNQFECHGCFELHVDMGLNAAYSKSYGFYYVTIYATNTNFIIKLPDLQFCGVMFGDRSLKAVGKSFIFQTSTDTYLQYSIGKSRKRMYQYSNKLKDADIGGGIFKVTKDYSKFLKNFDGKKSVEGAKPEDIIEKYCQISGKWYGDLFFDNVEYKSLKNGPFPIRPERPEILLPSDCLFREDIIYKVWGDNKKSNQQKEILQNLQRKDRKLREKYRK